jgi:anthranilate synthase/indole-3-glycerol phosphate synthase/phosphoribosylanthranilate isomerase
MAEVKRASPSKGDILPPSSPLTAATIAYSYAQAGASVISVLTEPTWFKGTLNDMLAVRNVVSTLANRPAILRKDFVFDTYQIDEARLYGADTVLLIVAMLDDPTLKHLYEYARYKRGMEPLVEVNNPEELKRALAIGAKVIGVNNRNLHDFNVDMGTTSRIAEVINDYSDRMNVQNGGVRDQRKVILCALSGITGREDVVRYVNEGVGAVLVGEALMKAEDRGAFVRTLLGVSTPTTKPRPRRMSHAQLTGPPDGLATPETAIDADAIPLNDITSPTHSSSKDGYKPLVKICGVKTVEAALTAAEAGADFIGLIFVPKSKRYIQLDQAKKVIDSVRARHTSTSAQEDEQNSPRGLSNDYFSLQAEKLSKTRRKPLFVGVFQNAPLETVLQTVDALHLDIVQLHGSEPAEWCRLLGVPTFKAFHVDEALSANDSEGHDSSSTLLALHEASRPGYHSIPLLDTKVGKSGLSGGAGKAFDWSIAQKLVKEKGLPILLAGGLEVENVGNAVKMVRPWGLDVSGGVETNGEKDLDKIRRFIVAAKQAV